MIRPKTKEEIQILREAGKRLYFVLQKLKEKSVEGVFLRDLDALGESMIRSGGDIPSFLNYTPEGANRPYPSSICISINDEIVHGISSESERVLRDGDVVTLDAGLTHKGLIVDSAITVVVGSVSDKVQKLLDVTERSLYKGIDQAKIGNHIGDISYAIEQFVKPYGFSIYKELVGHGVGYEVHEAPYVPNVGKAGTGPILEDGMVIAIEPMVGLGFDKIVLAKDGYTYKTADGSISAHFEHTIAITNDGPIILTTE
ncbi:type I methionyl aminopeptidase [Candidatus Campbellbacteria bacterium CG22_combo_CG10-13_8_21_14_all_36_13]|uniref:Methionine aminopeptidase n=1 Tax=Candidatus Campbellbacteria bacterium CG22_combo_CG10-13_8_21_14_all_36_13 TaxID=1974529 RepID=A0A2H0DYA2_9BACT|nr:MAG: type I methionyl aminopeptidase [Candidatus Campbellbacteria bacterium CG22_combo_CG10-13_8_21_14_all_36_13]